MKNNIGKFIISSTAAVYGELKVGVVTGNLLTVSINSYGKNKSHDKDQKKRDLIEYTNCMKFPAQKNLTITDYEPKLKHNIA